MNKIESILLELFEKYPQLTTAEIIEHTTLARRTVQKFSASLESMYQRRVIELKKQGVLQELGLVEKYGGVLMREKRFKKGE